MTRSTLRGTSQRSSDAAKSQWLRLATSDVEGVDGDIEALLDRVQQTQGGSRAMANAELVRRLSFAA